MLPDLTGNEFIHRMAVVLSQESGVQLLGIPKFKNATGENMAETVVSKLIDCVVYLYK